MVAAYPSKRTTTDFCMPAKNDHSDPRPVSTAPDEKPQKKTGKSSATGPAKASARTRSASKSAASEAAEPATPKPRRTVRSAANAEPEATPRVRRSARTGGVAAAEDAAVEALDARPLSDAQDATAIVEAEVRVRAYMLSLARGDAPGSPDGDWYQAEREIALSRQP